MPIGGLVAPGCACNPAAWSAGLAAQLQRSRTLWRQASRLPFILYDTEFMKNTVDKTESTLDTRRPWHAPALKALKASMTLANTIPGARYDATYSTFDAS
jgi:hypothetical protein